MRKWMTVLFAALVCLGLVACGKAGGDYSELIEMLDKGKYDAAHSYIDGLAEHKDDVVEEEEVDEESMASQVPGKWRIRWKNEENDTPETISFDKGGTCTIGEDECTWKVENEVKNYLQLILSEGKTEMYRVSVSKDGQDYYLSLRVKDGNDYISMGDYFNEGLYDKIEITKENLMDYFEIKDATNFGENSFGEVESFNYYKYLQLKPEYQEKFFVSEKNVALEISYMSGEKACKVNWDNKTFELGEEFKTWSDEKSDGIYECYNNGDAYRTSIMSSYMSKENTSGYLNSYIEDIEFLRVQGSLYFRK